MFLNPANRDSIIYITFFKLTNISALGNIHKKSMAVFSTEHA